MPGGDEDDTAAGDMRLLKQGCWKEVWRLTGISVTRTPLSKKHCYYNMWIFFIIARKF